MKSAVPRADPVQQFVHDVVLEAVAHGASHPGGTDPPLLPEHPKCLRHRIFRPAQDLGQIAHEDARRPVQHKQDLEAVRVGEQVEAPRPRGGVDIDECRGRPLHLYVPFDGVHIWKCKPNRP